MGGEQISDKEIEKIRNDLYELAELALDVWESTRGQKNLMVNTSSELKDRNISLPKIDNL